jgi:hypothetical protein
MGVFRSVLETISTHSMDRCVMCHVKWMERVGLKIVARWSQRPDLSRFGQWGSARKPWPKSLVVALYSSPT